MKRYDALVVGGGPAGSTTALRLAEGGASVLLVDKARFPRDKPCGGGLTMRAVRQSPVDVAAVVEEEVDLVELRFRYGDAVVRRARAPVILMTQRSRLDAYLAERAAEAGADFRDGVRVREVVQRLREAGMGDVPVVVGGIIPPEDDNILKQCGASAIYTPKDFQLNDIMVGIVKLVDAKAEVLAGISVPVPPLRAREKVPVSGT